jgi:HEXXH motif-containing protein
VPEPAELLWTATDLFHARHTKSASVLIALQRTLDRTRPLGGDEQEFLALYARLAAADSDAFTAVWSDPRAFFWTRIAYQLVRACLTGAPLSPLATAYAAALGTGSPPATLARHLDAFKELCLAVAERTGDDWIFERPFRARLPFTIAGARWALEGEGPIEVAGVAGGRLRVAHGGRTVEIALPGGDGGAPASGRGEDAGRAEGTAGGPVLRRAPVAAHAGCELVLNPFAFDLPGLDMAPALRATGLEYQERHRGLVVKALAAIDRYAPETFAHFRDTMRVAAAKRGPDGPFTNVSYSELPGACIVSVSDSPLAMADRLIHEYHHNRLFTVEEHGALFERPATAGPPAHYSPWRNDPRPLQGLFHAFYVYAPVTRFWLRALAAGDLAPADRAWAVERLLRTSRRFVLAESVLARAAEMTPFGRACFEELRARVGELQGEIARAGLPADVPALRMEEDGSTVPERSEVDERPLSVNEALAEHVRLHDLRGECAELVERVAAAAPGATL